MISKQWAHEPFHQFFERLQEALAIPSEDDIACTALHLAVLYGNLECCMLLLMRRPFIEDKDNRNRDQVQQSVSVVLSRPLKNRPRPLSPLCARPFAFVILC